VFDVDENSGALMAALWRRFRAILAQRKRKRRGY